MHGAASAIRIHDDNGSVPRISQFYGIVITMYFYDHQPPHFHAQYAEHHAVIAIDDHAADWQRVLSGSSPEPIEPLP